MGKWDRRYYRPRFRRRDYQDYDWSPPRDEPCPDPETEEWQDNVPMWEKKFCYLVGRMPWKKVLSTKTFMHCHSNILSWDDSAGKDAFDNAKKRFREELNGLPSASGLPNPDMYNDEIDWNPYIDSELVRDLDRSYFNPDDKYYLPSEHSSKGNNGWQGNDNNPWEEAQVQTSEVKDKATAWSQWDSWPGDDKNHQETGCVGGNVVKEKATGWDQWDNRADAGENQWECGGSTGWKQWDTSVNDKWGSHTKDSEAVRDSSWGGGNSSWGAKPENRVDVAKNWNSGGPNSWRNDGNRWQDRGPHSRNWNQKTSEFHRSNHPNNKYRPPQGYGSHQGSRGPNSGRGSSWGQKRWDHSSSSNNNTNDNKWEAKEFGNNPRGGGQFNAACRKREGPDQYAVNHKGPRLQGGESHSSHYWNGANNNKRVTFGGQWS